MPLVENVAAVVDNHSVVSQEHHIPLLVVGQAVVNAIELESAWIRDILTRHEGSWPDLSAVRQNSVKESIVLDLTVLDLKCQLLAVVAIVKWVETSNGVPKTFEHIVIDGFDNISWVAALCIVDRVRRGKPEALVIDKEAGEHIVDRLAGISPSAQDWAASVALGATSSALKLCSTL